jgi:rhomboid family GlyGly-CTERM serine protease
MDAPVVAAIAVASFTGFLMNSWNRAGGPWAAGHSTEMIKTDKTPVLTLATLLVMAGIHFLPLTRELFYFSAEAVWQGQLWRLLSGHLVHADLNHLLWNGIGLGILGVMTEQHSRRAWWVAMLTGVLFVNLLLLSPFSQLAYYCGVSGVLHTLLVVVLWLEWRHSPSWRVPLVAVLALVKTLVEIHSGNAMLSNITWPPYAWSHAAGILGGVIIIGPGASLLPRLKLYPDRITHRYDHSN